MRSKSVLCIIVSAFCGGLLLSGCGDKIGTYSDNGSDTVLETMTAGTSGTAETGDKQMSTSTAEVSSEPDLPEDSEYNKAYNALKHFLEGCAANDRDAVLENSNLGSFIISDPEAGDVNAYINSRFEELCSVQTFVIGEGADRSNELYLYNDYVQVRLSELNSGTVSGVQDSLSGLYANAEAKYLFPIRVNAEAESLFLNSSGIQTAEVIRRGDHWAVELGLADYICSEWMQDADGRAKSLMAAVNAAIADLQAGGSDPAEFNGLYDVEGAMAAQTMLGSDAEGRLFSKLSQYFPNMELYEKIMFQIDGGQCNASAVGLTKIEMQVVICGAAPVSVNDPALQAQCDPPEKALFYAIHGSF